MPLLQDLYEELLKQPDPEAKRAATWCCLDEFHILLRDPLTASYFVAV